MDLNLLLGIPARELLFKKCQTKKRPWGHSFPAGVAMTRSPWAGTHHHPGRHSGPLTQAKALGSWEEGWWAPEVVDEGAARIWGIERLTRPQTGSTSGTGRGTGLSTPFCDGLY